MHHATTRELLGKIPPELAGTQEEREWLKEIVELVPYSGVDIYVAPKNIHRIKLPTVEAEIAKVLQGRDDLAAEIGIDAEHAKWLLTILISDLADKYYFERGSRLIITEDGYLQHDGEDYSQEFLSSNSVSYTSPTR